MMEILCRDHRDEFIYWTTYEIDSRKYKHYCDDPKLFSNNAEEILLQVVATCTWAYEYHKLTERMTDPYLPYMLWAQSCKYEDWEVLTIANLTPLRVSSQMQGQGMVEVPLSSYYSFGRTTMLQSELRAAPFGRCWC